ncbi:MAG: AAA family ATPase [Propionibacteriaceae bacterium]
MSKGGFVAFRGSSAVAESYLAGEPQELDAGVSAAYLAHADRPFQHGMITVDGAEVDALTRNEFRAWAEHIDPETGQVRGRFRTKTTRSLDKDGNLVEKVGGTPLYQETLVSASKSLSLAAASNPDIAEALEGAMERSTVRMAEAFHEHAVTRVGRRGEQEQQKFDRIEFTSVQHHTSRTGDPHEHRHVQFLTTGLVTLPNGMQEWRAPDGAVLYRLPERLHAAADLSLSTDVQLRQAIADAGFTWEPGEGGGKVAEFESLTDEFSQRRDQVAGRREMLEAQWRAEHPRQEPSPKQLRTWDNHGWAATRPEKKELEQEAREDQVDKLAGVQPTNTGHAVTREAVGQVDAAFIASETLADLAAQRSAWSTADVKASIDRSLARTHLLGDEGITQLQEASLEAARAELVSFYDHGIDIEGAQHYTSKAVLATDRAIEGSLRRRAQCNGVGGAVEVDRGGFELTDGQAAAARAITGTHGLVVVEGAAGTGKTALLSAANEQILDEGRRMVAVSPTKRGAMEMATEIGAQGNSVHGMLVRAGATFDDRGRWALPEAWKKQPSESAMDQNTVLVVDEAGMLDMGTAEVLHKYCEDTDVRLVLLGDRKQLAAVGRGGYLPKAVHAATSAHDLRDVRRFQTADEQNDQEYADATLKLRDRENPAQFFDLLHERGHVQVGEPDEVLERVAETVALEVDADRTSVAVASTNATAQRLNHKVYERLVTSGAIDDQITVEGRDGDPIAVGAKVATRQNDNELQVANRQTFIVKRVNSDGRVIVADEETRHHSTLDAEYVQQNLQLAYAVTAHGSQGMTVDTAHTVLSDQMDAAGTYVGLTRGRRANVLHAVATDLDDAKAQFEAAVDRQGADQGVDEAQARAEQAREGLLNQAAEQVRPEIAVEGVDTEALHDAGEDSTTTAKDTSSSSMLHDLASESESPTMQRRLTRLAEIQEQWHEEMPRTDDERRAFERQVSAAGIGRTTLEHEDVEGSTDAELYGLLMDRVEQGELANAAGERRDGFTRDIEDLKEFQRTRDPFGVHGTGQKITIAEEGLEFERGFIDRVRTDRTNGVYSTRAHEVHRHYQRHDRGTDTGASGAEQGVQATQARARIETASKNLAQDKGRADDREPTQSQDYDQSMG